MLARYHCGSLYSLALLSAGKLRLARWVFFVKISTWETRGLPPGLIVAILVVVARFHPGCGSPGPSVVGAWFLVARSSAHVRRMHFK